MPLRSSEHMGHTQETLPGLQVRVKRRAWRAAFSDLGYRRRREDQHESSMGGQSRGPGSALCRAGVAVYPKFQVRGAATERGPVEAGHHCPERSYPLHSQGDTQKAEGFFSLGLQQDVWVRETEEGLAGVETDGT